MKHTPTPWIAKDHHIYAENTNLHVADIARAGDGDWSPGNAEFIVRTVNSHDELLSAIKRIMTYKTDSGFCNGSLLMKDIATLQLAIAKAEGTL